MTPKSLLAVFALAIIVAIAGYFHFNRDVDESPLIDARAPSHSQAVRPDQAANADVSLPSPDHVEAASNDDPADPPKIYGVSVTGELEEAEIVFGHKVKKNRNCTIVIDHYSTHEDGTTSPVYNCVPNNPKPVDIYTTYSNAELETLAYSDSHAAYNLTLRLREKDYPKAIYYGLRSAALTGDVKGISLMTVYIPHSAKIGDEWNPEYFAEQYVLRGVAQAVNSSNKAHIPRTSRQAISLQINGMDIEALDAQIADHLKTIENIRSEVGIE